MIRPPRILVLRGGAIGDFVLTLPALQALRRRWPEAHIELIGYPHIAALAQAGGLADAVRSLDSARIARLYAPGETLPSEDQAYFHSFDFVLTYLHDPHDVVRDNLLANGAREVLECPPFPGRGHAGDHFVHPLEIYALYEAGTAPALTLNPDRLAAGRARLAALGASAHPVIVHPGSGSVQKNWPAERFVEAAGRLRAAGCDLCFLLGEADDALAPRVRAAAPARGPVIEGLELIEAAGVLAHARAYVGNDSGMTHLAAALGAPTLALFGPTDPAVWGPRGRRVAILRAPGGDLAALDANFVATRLLELIAAAEGGRPAG